MVQRYGREVFGGAETYARDMATQLAARGHTVEVLTSCAVTYVDWANHYPEGSSVLDGVLVHRLPVRRLREPRVFGPLSSRIVEDPVGVPLHLQREWVRLQGPFIPELSTWLADRSLEYDAAIFVTYLYYTTWAGLPAARGPRVFHPTAHDEWQLNLDVYDRIFHLSDAFGFLTPEEGQLVTKRFGVQRPQQVTGMGIDLRRPADPAAFRQRFGLGDGPYIAYAGRIDTAKGSEELYRYFSEFKRRHPGPLKLVLIGEEVARLPARPDVVKTGFVDGAVRDSGLAGAELLVQPSRFESFSIVLCEAWVAGIPALVQGRSDVLVGQAHRSGGALPYWTYAEFEAGLELLLADAVLRQRMAAAGRAYVEANYAWNEVLSGYETFLERVSRTAS